jgi:hypothetical protein
MARIRYLKPETATDEVLAKVSILARLFYRDLWCHMDRQGVVENSPKMLKGKIFPFDDSITGKKVEGLINELVGIKRLFRFIYNNKDMLFCPSLRKHQNFHPSERPHWNIPESNLLAACKQPAEQYTSTMGNGELVIGNGEASEQLRCVEGAVGLEDFWGIFRDRGVSSDNQEKLLRAFPDPVWVRHEIHKAISWESANPRRKKKNFAPFLHRWLTKGWDQFRSTPSPSIRKEVSAEEALKLIEAGKL